MVNNFETDFISETKEKMPFADIPAQNFFAEWCRINDSIVPQFISREEWEQRGAQGILEKNEEGKQNLFLPEDLRLWEMIDVIRTVDHDTFARKPDLRGQRAEQIAELGQTFEKAGIYLNQYLPDIKDGNDIAQIISSEFYSYGRSLQEKVKSTDELPPDTQLTEEDKQKLDEWFLGKDAYQKRMARLGENPTPKQIEDRRKELFQIYFKALGREGYKADGEKPWKTKKGPIQHLQDKTRRQITRIIETPEREMKTALFRRGVEKLVTEMKEGGWRKAINDFLKKVGFDPLLEQRRLYDVLQIPKLKKELAKIRDIPAIAKKEREIAEKIQKAVCGFDYEKNANNPSEMVETQFINCVGSSILGSGLLDEVGIKYLHINLPEHSATVLITSDGKVYWQDFTPPAGYTYNHEITEESLLEDKQKVTDITNFARNPKDSSLSITVKVPWEPNKKVRASLSNSEINLQASILNNVGSALSGLGRNEEAMKAYKQAIDADPEDASPYNGLGSALSGLGRNEEAMKAYKQAIDADPEDASPYNGLGSALSGLGRNEEAIKAYKTFIELEGDGDQLWIKRAERIIRELQRRK